MRNLWIFVLWSVENGEWSAENGNLAKCLCKFKVWIFRFVLTHSAQNDRVLVILSVAKYP